MAMTKAKALKALHAVGADVDWENTSWGDYTLDAPTGKIFNANNCHSYYVGERGYGDTTMAEIWQLIWEVADEGLRDCDGVICGRSPEEEH